MSLSIQPARSLQLQRQGLQNQLLLMKSATDASNGQAQAAVESKLKAVTTALASAKRGRFERRA